MAAGIIQVNSGTVTAANSGTASFPSAVSRGHNILYIVGVASGTSIATAPSDTIGSTYVDLGDFTSAATPAAEIRTYLATNVAGGSFTITSNLSSSGTATFQVFELSGSIALDATATIATATSSFITSNNATPVKREVPSFRIGAFCNVSSTTSASAPIPGWQYLSSNGSLSLFTCSSPISSFAAGGMSCSWSGSVATVSNCWLFNVGGSTFSYGSHVSAGDGISRSEIAN